MPQLDALPTESETFLLCVVGTTEFLLPILDVKEVAEGTLVTPYPIKSPGHIGVVNLRGNVVPVISVNAVNGDYCPKKTASRLVILAADKGQSFAIQACSVKKITSNSLDIEKTRTLNLNGRPVSLVRPLDLLQKWGIAC